LKSELEVVEDLIKVKECNEHKEAIKKYTKQQETVRKRI
jgi:hypothetical protein